MKKYLPDSFRDIVFTTTKGKTYKGFYCPDDNTFREFKKWWGQRIFSPDDIYGWHNVPEKSTFKFNNFKN